MQIHVGDIATLRKTHPCGSRQWEVYRIGADIGVRCLGCGRRVMLPRRQFERAVKHLDHPPAEPLAEPPIDDVPPAGDASPAGGEAG